MNFRAKIMALEDIRTWREQARRDGRRVVVTNGCFDLLHAGHVTYLEAARNLGDALLVGLNSDASVRRLKGESRPVNPEPDRALVLAALESLSAVAIFPETSAAAFLRLVEPDIYVKGADYTLEKMNQEERRIVEGCGGEIHFLTFVAGKSTTTLLARLGQADGGPVTGCGARRSHRRRPRGAVLPASRC